MTQSPFSNYRQNIFIDNILGAFLWFCNFFPLIFVIKDAPGGRLVRGVFRTILDCPEGVPGVFNRHLWTGV